MGEPKAPPGPASASSDFWAWGGWKPETLRSSSGFRHYLRGHGWDGLKEKL